MRTKLVLTLGMLVTIIGLVVITANQNMLVAHEPAGCTPGFWKNHPEAWCSTYSPTQPLSSVFTIPASLGVPDLTLLGALSFQGGSTLEGAAEILLRAAVAALLNACAFADGFPLTTTEVITQVNSALASGDRDTILTLAATLDKYNNIGCPL